MRRASTLALLLCVVAPGCLGGGEGRPGDVASNTDSLTGGLVPVADNGLNQASPFANAGTAKSMSVDVPGGNQQVSVLRFDQAAIASAAAGRSLYRATLEMTVLLSNFPSGWNGGKIGAHRMQRSWTERSGSMGATWGCAADTNVSNSASDCTAADKWGMNPGDADPLPYVAEPTDTVRVYSDNLTTFMDFDVTADVQGFLRGMPNNGWMLRIAAGGVIGTHVDFYTREGLSPPTLYLEFGPDMCPGDAAKTTPGQCGCNTPDTDTDQDGAADCREPSLVPIADSDIWKRKPNLNDGIGILLGAGSSKYPERSLVRFDQAEIADATQGKVLEQATLEMTVSWRPNGWNGGLIDLFPMTRSWDEGIGLFSGTPGSTWVCARDTNTLNLDTNCPPAFRWNMESNPKPFGATPSATAALRDSDKTITFDVTADIRKYLDGSLPNYGWIMIGRDGSNNPGWVYFGSSESETPPRLGLKVKDAGGGSGGTKVVSMPAPSVDLDADVPKTTDGSPVTVSSNPQKPVDFTLLTEFPLAGGVLANGTVTLSYDPPSGGRVTCTWKGGSPTSEPSTPEDLNLGRYAKLTACSDGTDGTTRRTGTNFTLTVDPVPGYPVNVTAPITDDYACDDEFELMSAVETTRLRTGFSWDRATKVQETTPEDGRPSLFHAWIYVRNKTEELAIKQLAIHVLKRPLFDEELLKYAGRCGTFTNPGDGGGAFVPVLIPGRTYNRLIDVRTSPDVMGNRQIFDAVILRDVPLAARTSINSVNLSILASSGFRYLDYERHPLPPFSEVKLDAGASKVLADALEWVATAIGDVGDAINNLTNELDQLIRGEVIMTIDARTVTKDAAFSGVNVQFMHRGWGTAAGDPLAPVGMEVTIMQRTNEFFGFALGHTAQGTTDFSGRAVIDAVENGTADGAGICFTLDTPGVRVTDFLWAAETCDFRGYFVGSQFNPPSQPATKLTLSDFSHDSTVEFHVDSKRLMALTEADDAYQWGKNVAGFTKKKARVMTGFFGTTFAGIGNAGAFTPCMNYPNRVSDLTVSALAAAFVGIPVAGPYAAAAVSAFASILTNSDILLSMADKPSGPDSIGIGEDRLVMTHEYGHYLFCSMRVEVDSTNTDRIITQAATHGDDITVPDRYLNEAFADFVTGQVAGGMQYAWMPRGVAINRRFCVPNSPTVNTNQPCWDRNLNGDSPETDLLQDAAFERTGRIATLLHDLFDGNGMRSMLVPNDGDVWTDMMGPQRLTFSPLGFGNIDFDLERIALTGPSLVNFAQGIARRQNELDDITNSVSDQDIYTAANNTLMEAGYSWCDRCRVFALHDPSTGATTPGTVQDLFRVCTAGGVAATTVGPPPVASLRLDAEMCKECEPFTTSDANGACQPCADFVIGNSCTTCPADAFYDAATAAFTLTPFDTSLSAMGDTCPDTFWVEVRNASQAFARGGTGLSATLEALDAMACNRPLEVQSARVLSGDRVTTIEVKQVPTGNWADATGCANEPAFQYTPMTLPADTLRFGTPRIPNVRLNLSIETSPL